MDSGKDDYTFAAHQHDRMTVQIEPGWKKVLNPEFTKPYFLQIVHFLKTEKNLGKVIYPPGSQIFRAFEMSSFEKTKLVILGQDPYHGPGQANGLSFSVSDGIRPPPSLQNIYKELHTDIGMAIPQTGNLSPWAGQGVLLLNAYLTVLANSPASHSQAGWGEFTDMVIQKLSDLKNNLVFLLWGKFAHEKQSLIDETRHLVLKAAHPSPFSVEKGFYGCRHFSKANQYLMKHGMDPIDWKL